MKKTSFTNNGTTPVYAGGVLVRPGETRLVDPTAVDGLTDAPEAPAPSGDQTNSLLSLLDQSVAKITKGLAELSDQDIEALRVAEENGKTRKGVLQAIEALRIERVAAAEAAAAEGAGD